MGWEKHQENERERGIGFDYAALIFLNHVIEWIDDRVDYEEVRIRAVGTTGTDILHVVYTDRGNVRRIISARIASRKERKKWLAEPLNK